MASKPCFKCPDRHQRCWSDCERYAVFKSEIEAEKKEHSKGKSANGFLYENCRKAKRRAHRK